MVCTVPVCMNTGRMEVSCVALCCTYLVVLTYAARGR